ncbi:MAG: DUF2953 domain-containing protein [Eubacterium sp.]|nr:DUF2953 domain-containing protein [Eubacterium sp.]
MKVFLIILAVLFILITLLMLLSAEFTIIFDNGWTTKVRVLFFEFDIKLSKLLSFILMPEKAAEDAKENQKEKKKTKEETKAQTEAEKTEEETIVEEEQKEEITEENKEEAKVPAVEDKPKKPNFIQKLYNDEGIVGILLLISNLLQTVNSAVTTLIKGLHIYSLYVKMIIGGGDPADIGEKYGAICSWYYPMKGIILNQMKVDEYDDYIQADFISPRSEYELQFIGSISVGLLVKVLLKAGKVFVVNLIKNK